MKITKQNLNNFNVNIIKETNGNKVIHLTIELKNEKIKYRIPRDKRHKHETVKDMAKKINDFFSDIQNGNSKSLKIDEYLERSYITIYAENNSPQYTAQKII